MSVTIGPGSTFAGYLVESLVGRGGMGVVYRATDLSLQRPVALKLIAPKLAQDERFRARFLREPRLAASLDHPNVIPIYEAGEHDGQLYLVMRFVEGSDLKALLERERTLEPERAVALLAQVAGALDAAHRRGLVHRDVKPANVLLDEEGHAYLTDFGITKQLGGDSTDTAQVVGTLDYLAPEQIRTEAVDGRTDGYALACVLHECLSGTPPFRRETEAETLWAHMQEQPAPLSGHSALDPVLAQALAKDKEARYASCAEFLAAASSALGFEAPARRARRIRVGRRFVLAGALLLVAAVCAATLVSLTGDDRSDTGRLARVAPDSVAVLDPRSNRVVGQVRIPGRPSVLATHGRSVWVASESSRTISAISGRSLDVTKVVPANATPRDVVATAGSVWLLDAQRHSLVEVDAAYGSVANRFSLPAAAPKQVPFGWGVASGQGALWVTNGTTRLLKLDPQDGRVLRTVDLHRPLDDVAVGHGSVWAISGASASVFEIDPSSGSARRIAISGRPGSTRPIPSAVATDENGVWVLNGNAPSVTRIDPQLAAVSATIPLAVGSNPSAIATGAGAVWVALSGEGAVARIDPGSNVARSIPVGGAPTGVAVGLRRVWVSVQPGFRAGLADRERTIQVPGAIEEPFCGPVEFAGKKAPRLLVVSDLPLQTDRVGRSQPLQFSDAIRFVLARHDFRAGRYRLGYQSCDDSVHTVEGPWWTPGACRRNARAYANAPIVVGVIGPFNSGCAAPEIPILNRARGGPLATISGSATTVGLTHRGPGAVRGEPRIYYPRGVRNFARVVAADDVQGAASAVMAKRLGVRRLYVLDDDESYGIGIAATVRRAASKLGVAIVGSGRWGFQEGFQEGGFRRLAKRIERSGADGVFLGGLSVLNGNRLLRDLRAVLGRRVQILAPDGFSDFPVVVEEAGAAAEGLVVSFPAVSAEQLPPSGRRFVEAFGKAIGRGPVEPFSTSTAQATEVLLEAIAASDGTRASVTEQLFRVRVKNGILGSFEFDANGDTTSAGVTMYRIEKGKPRVLGVITPPRSLVR